jgi:hypothetical protein
MSEDLAELYAWRMVIRARIMRNKVIGCVMEREFIWAKIAGVPAAALAATVEDYFGFAARDVAAVHRHQHGIGDGTFFRLYDGRVFDGAANAQSPDPALYETTLH